MKKMILMLALLMLAMAVYGQIRVPEAGVYSLDTEMNNIYDSDEGFMTRNFLFHVEVLPNGMLVVGVDADWNGVVDGYEIATVPTGLLDDGDGHYLYAEVGVQWYEFWHYQPTGENIFRLNNRYKYVEMRMVMQ